MTATHDSASLRPSRWIFALRRTRLVLIAAAVAFGVLWMLGTIAAVPALVGFAAIAAAALIVAVNTEPAPAPASVIRDEPSAPGIADPLIQAVLSAVPDPVVAVDHRGDVVALNARATAIAPALRPGESVSLGLRVPEVLDAIRNARASGTSQRGEFFQRVPLERWYEAIATPISPSALKGGLVLLAFHDLTPLRRVEEMRADFVANASHELRTPLAALSGFIDTLRGSAREDPAARERFLGIMQAQADRMARLIDDLLSLSRIELNAHLRPDKEIDLVAIVRQVSDTLQTLARDRGVEVKTAGSSDPLVVLGDRDELIRVFENLVENALKYAASGKRVEIDLSVADGADSKPEARVAVRDHGPGIAPEHLPRLTERFYRVDVTESRAQGGTGLGLALVKHILNRHGGRLTIESVLGQGATFTAHLPLSEPRRDEIRAS